MCFTKKKVVFLLIASICINCFAADKFTKWEMMKPLEKIDANFIISIANSDEGNGAFVLPISTDKSLAFFFTTASHNYQMPLADPTNERILVATFDPKTKKVGDGICLEVPSSWKSYIHVAPNAMCMFATDKVNGNSCVFYEIESNSFTTVNIGSMNCMGGSLAYKADNPPRYTYYYFWDPYTKELCSVSPISDSVKKSGIKMGMPYFYDENAAFGKKDERKVIVADTEDTYEKDGKTYSNSVYLCVSGLFIKYDPVF